MEPKFEYKHNHNTAMWLVGETDGGYYNRNKLWVCRKETNKVTGV